MNNVILAACALTVMIFSSNASATAQTATKKSVDIIWGINVSPPFHVTQGEYQNMGICDVLVDVIKQQLPHLSHQIRHLPARRITLLMKRERNLCFPCLIKRSSYNSEFNYTETTHRYPAHGIVAHASAAQQIADRYGNPVSFEALVKDTNFRFAQPIERRYGSLQSLLEEHLVGRPHYRIVTGDNAHVNLMTMLLNNRVDYTLDYEMVKRFYEKTHAIAASNDLVFLPIAEYNNKVIDGAIGCSNSDWGKAAAKQLNAVVPGLQANDRFQQALDLWLGENRPK